MGGLPPAGLEEAVGLGHDGLCCWRGVVQTGLWFDVDYGIKGPCLGCLVTFLVFFWHGAGSTTGTVDKWVNEGGKRTRRPFRPPKKQRKRVEGLGRSHVHVAFESTNCINHRCSGAVAAAVVVE